ncbi:heparin lyase I family protein [Bradyrhizobium sp. CIAT3101]|uniref:heparin lyase I family protein n=1 Tax=Bradyrhizobium sp. CIAT3101 TaxID=439387 RepID=UPI0024B212E7|nr:heparin lyase I family protein [Bradyrhizobium sp. CIAT3101]WFU79145.1 heparin lyase I family protein [Bradyrhizobium sp. CIAT3101]
MATQFLEGKGSKMRIADSVGTAAATILVSALLSANCTSKAQNTNPPDWAAVANSGKVIVVRNTPYVAESVGSDWSIRRASAGAIDIVRFEVRAGDIWSEDRASGENKERSELDGYKRRFEYGSDVWGAYSFLIEPGADYQSDWTAISQMHGSKIRPFHLHFKLGRLVIYAEALGTRSQTSTLYNGTLSRNEWHHLVFHLREGVPDGQLEIWLDGKKAVDFSGMIGAPGNQAYWKYGIYRGYGPISTPLAIQFANMEVGTSELSSRVTAPLPVK